MIYLLRLVFPCLTYMAWERNFPVLAVVFCLLAIDLCCRDTKEWPL